MGEVCKNKKMDGEDMFFEILRNEQQLEKVRSQCPLFYDECLPQISATDDGRRYAVVGDHESTVLAILTQVYPYKDVTVTSLVVTDIQGVKKLVHFLRRFVIGARPYIKTLQITPQSTAMHLRNNVRPADIERVLHQTK